MAVPINYLAVLIAAIAGMFVGFIWYGLLFKRKWMNLMGYTPKSMANMKMSPTTAYIISFISYIIMAYVLAHAIVFGSTYTGIYGAVAGLWAGFYYWLGFTVPVSLGIVLWENKSWKLWFINTSNYLIALLVMGAILAAWM